MQHAPPAQLLAQPAGSQENAAPYPTTGAATDMDPIHAGGLTLRVFTKDSVREQARQGGPTDRGSHRLTCHNVDSITVALMSQFKGFLKFSVAKNAGGVWEIVAQVLDEENARFVNRHFIFIKADHKYVLPSADQEKRTSPFPFASLEKVVLDVWHDEATCYLQA